MMRKITVLLVFLLVASMSNAFAQTRTITGKVTGSQDGVAIPGVTVLVKGTTIGAITNFDGIYSINVKPEHKTLVFSYVSMKKLEVTLGAQTTINVVMQPDNILIDEVVVTALGISREKKSLGYSVQDVSGDELNKARETNILNSLSGKVSGLQVTSSSGAVGASSRIVVRGVSSLGGNNQPMFIVDGVPLNNEELGSTGTYGVNRGNAAADINPNDIHSISVLKGPNAAALYGSRAANGVILITTKAAMQQGGKMKKGIGIEISNSTTFETPFRLPDFQDEYGQGSVGAFSFLDGAGHGINDGFDESWGPKLDGRLIDQFFGKQQPWVAAPNNVRDFFETGITSSTNIAISGGDKLGSFRVSFGNTTQTGMLPNTDQTKNNLSIGAVASPSDKLTISGSANYVNTNSKNLPGYGYDAQNVMQQFMWFGRQVDISRLKNYKNADGSLFNWNYNYHNNPYFTLYENTNGMNRDRLMGNAKINYIITDNLSAMVRTGLDSYSNLNTGRIAAGDIETIHGSYAETLLSFREYNTDFLFMYNRTMGENLSLNFNFGGNRMDQNYHSVFGSADELAIPGVYTLSNSRVPLRTASIDRNKRINSLYFSGQVGFKYGLYADFTGRNDWSSTLPEGKNSYFYPSISISAVFTELLGKNLGPLSYGKARIGYAKVGSDTDPYQLSPFLSFGDGWNASSKLLNLFVPNNLPNSELKPQFANSFEVGADLKFYENRISLDVTYYNQATIDQIISIPISPASGYTSKNINAGEITNQGIELSLGVDVFEKKSPFQWNATINFSSNKNEVVSLATGVEQYELGTYWSLKVLAIPGQAYGSLYGYDYRRDPNGNIINVNGVPEAGDLKVLGNFQPDWIGGMNNNFSYKGFTGGFLIDVRKGGDIYTMTTTWGRYAGVLKETLIGREGGIVGVGVKEVFGPGGSVTYVPNDIVVDAETYNKAAFNNDIAAGSVFDASFVKLREVRLGYNFGKIKNTPLQDVSLSLIGRNLALLYSKVPHIDPETSFNSGNVQGLEFGQIPSARSIGFNLSAKF